MPGLGDVFTHLLELIQPKFVHDPQIFGLELRCNLFDIWEAISIQECVGAIAVMGSAATVAVELAVYFKRASFYTLSNWSVLDSIVQEWIF